MHRNATVSVLAAAAALGHLGGCTSAPRYTQAQLNAIETRVVEADFDATFDAASGALFDAGYIIAMSDRPGGLITGTQVTEAAGWDQFWGGPDPRLLAISIQVRSKEPDQSIVRIKTQVNGRVRVDQAAINKIWILMQRQVLMGGPPPTAAQAEPDAAPPPDREGPAGP